MTKKSRREQYADETRQAIVESALILYASKGFAGTSIDAVADAARVTKGAVYHHFKDKKALFKACFEVQGQLVADALSQVSKGDNAWQYATNLCQEFLEFVLSKGHTTIPLPEVITVLGWQTWRQIDTRFTIGFVETVVDDLVSTGELKPYPRELVVNMIHGMMVDASMSLIQARKKPETRRQLVDMLAGMLSGLKREPEQGVF